MSASQFSRGQSCPKCGAQLVPRANYCWLCGHAVAVSPSNIDKAMPAFVESDSSRQNSVLWIVVLFASLGLLALLASVWDDLGADPLFRNSALAIAVPGVAIVAVVTALVSRHSHGPGSKEPLLVGALGVIGVVAVSVFAAIAVVVASFFAFVLTCGAAGRFGP